MTLNVLTFMNLFSRRTLVSLRKMLNGLRLPLMGLVTLIAVGLSSFVWFNRAVFSDEFNLALMNGILLMTLAAALTARWYYKNLEKEGRHRLMLAEARHRAAMSTGQQADDAKYALLEVTLDCLNQGLAMVDPHGQILLFNKRGVEYSGVDPSEFPSLPASAKDVFRMQWQHGEFGKDGCLLPEDVRRYFITGQGILPKSYIRRRPNGTVLEVRSEPLPNGGIVQSYTDITELTRATEAAEAGARAKTAFLATMSHEIRTPLNGVLGMATLLRQSALSKEQLEWVRIISESGDALMSVINDILDFSKLEAGKVELAQDPFDVTHLARSALDVVKATAKIKGLRLDLTVAADAPKTVEIDGKRIRQVLLNFLGNAVKFTDQGSVALRISKSTTLADGLRFEVRDSGIGISDEGKERLFKEFSQIDASINRRFGGTGLGLAICAKIIETMKGKIGVESRQGHGSTFWFEIVAPACAAPMPVERRSTLPRTRHAAYRVLIVEDMPVNQMVARGMLKSLGHSADVANDGLEAVEMVQHESFDIILMDMQMPRLNGLDATKAIRALGGEFAQVPIVAMTANAFDSDRDECLLAGMNDFVAKPIEIDKLEAAIDRVMVARAPAAERTALPVASRFGHLNRLVQYVGLEAADTLMDAFEVDYHLQLKTIAHVSQANDAPGIEQAYTSLREAMLALGLDVSPLPQFNMLDGQDAVSKCLSGKPLQQFIGQEVRDARIWLDGERRKMLEASAKPKALAA